MLYSNIHTHLPAQRMIFGFGRAETKSKREKDCSYSITNQESKISLLLLETPVTA